MADLNPIDILRFLCGLAWADDWVTPNERAYLLNLAQWMQLSDTEMRQVASWLDRPPENVQLDGSALSDADREALFQQALILFGADGNVSLDEQQVIATLRQMLDLTPDQLADLERRVERLFGALPPKPG